MIRGRSLKNAAVLLTVCVALLLLNNFFIAREAKVENIPVCQPRVNYEPKNHLQEVPCVADGGKTMTCVRNGEEVFFPFNFIKKQFGVSGKNNKDGFELITSYAKVRAPEGKTYDSAGVFGHFATYNVENRERVRCISAATGVPMSTQWDTIPYFYPIQIAQYGLQHYSRMKMANDSQSQVITVGTLSKEWKGSPGESGTSERIFYKDPDHGPVVNITSSDNAANPGGYLFFDSDPTLNIVSFNWRPLENASFTILARVVSTDKLILLNYVSGSNKNCVAVEGGGKISDEQITFSYFTGDSNSEDSGWKSVTRDVFVDAARAMSSLNTQKKKEGNVIYHPGDVKLVTLGFHGVSVVEQKIEQRTEAHRKFFLTAADWMMENQDKNGGWSVPVERSIAEKRLVLPAGWYSAMAQGHGLSLLTRAFIETGNSSYLESATKALSLFEKSASEGGVVNEFLGYKWYEEYPTTPGSFVLNGFMYSLIGLYDLSALPNSEESSSTTSAKVKAKELFDVGIASLRLLLPLYDTGSGSIYDLRHFGLKTAPNLARWDYHAVHVYLLKWLVQITGDRELDGTARRWIGYSYGKRAKHN